MSSTQRPYAGTTASLLGALIAGGLSAALFVLALGQAQAEPSILKIYLISLPLFFAGLPLFLVGLSHGAVAGLIAALTGTGALFGVLSGALSFQYFLIFALPTFALVGLALRHRTGDDGKAYWYPESYLMTALTLYPCAIFLALVMHYAAYPGGFLGLTTHFFDEIADLLSKQASPDQAVMIHSMMPTIAKIMPSIMGWTWVAWTSVSFLVAQAILQKGEWNQRPPFALLDVSVPLAVIVALALTGLVGFGAAAPWNYIGQNLAIILGLPLFFTGLAVVHVWAARTQHPGLLLTVFYLVLSVFVFFVPLVAMLSVFDQWFHVRERWKQHKQSV